MKKALRWIAVSVGFAIAALFVVWAIMNAIWGAELRKTITEIKARGEPMTIAEIVPAYVPPEKNAVVELNKAFALMCSDKSNEQYIPFKQGWKLKANIEMVNNFYPKMKQASAEERKKNFDLIDSPELAELFALLKAAALKPGYNADLKYEDGFAMLLPNLAIFRTAIRLLCLKALAQANKGDIAGAGDTLMTAIKVSDHLENEPNLIFLLVRIACLATTAETLDNLADDFQFPEKDAQNLIAELGKINPTKQLKKSLIAERVCFGQTAFDGFVSGKHKYDYFSVMGSRSRLIYFTWKPFLKKDYCEYLRIMSSYSKACDTPFYSFPAVQHSPRYCLFSRLLAPNLTKVFEKNAAAQTKLAISKIKLALNIYKGRHGAFPENLDALKPNILPAIPIDELTGTPLTYKKEGGKYVLFSDTVQKREEERKREREEVEREREEQRKKDAKK